MKPHLRRWKASFVALAVVLGMASFLGATYLVLSSVGARASAKAAREDLSQHWGIEVPPASLSVVQRRTEANMDAKYRLTVLQPTRDARLEGGFLDPVEMAGTALTAEESEFVESVNTSLSPQPLLSPHATVKKSILTQPSDRYPAARETLLSLYDPATNRFFLYEERW